MFLPGSSLFWDFSFEPLSLLHEFKCLMLLACRQKKKVWLVLVQICNFSTQHDGLAQGRLCSRALSQCATPAGQEPPGEALLLTSATRPLETISAHFLLSREVTGGCKAAGSTVCVQVHCAKS